ncbi:endopeptidase La [Treponema brennaborense]|uniref:Lon protease n=1 Tax=Treponema brennaborense (strain DSM 12168 / CIP 105900 / DD5/3) TaxID=906968 RepID=F4LP92_TREBD|nr:endopeptidase La [Treponema brennaborense]AEE16954.1 anti-sigma H sporulation factor, LonB [Treponema brennaborense DSM 12168]
MSEKNTDTDTVDIIIEESAQSPADETSRRNSPAETGAAEKEAESAKSGDAESASADDSAPEATIVPVEQTLSNKLFLIPLSGRPIFPGIFTPLMITSADDAKVAEQAYSGDGLIGIVMLKNETESPSVSDMHEIGTVARIIKKINLPDGGVNVFISTIKRFRIRKVLSNREPMVAIVEYLEDEEDDTFEVKALTRALISEMKEVSENNPLFSEEMRLNMVNIDHPGKIADFIASILNIDKDDQQRVLEMLNVRQRMEQVLVFIKKEQELLRIQKKIQNELNDRIETQQREYFLREELKSIKEELGMTTDAQNSDYQKFKEKIDSFKFQGEIKETVDNELEKFSLMDPNASEYIVVRNYLETIASLPWGDPPPEDFELERARKILEQDHYGLEDVKKRILEYLAVRKLKKDSKGSILILVGPPGVGKTSIGHSIASAMQKPFFRFSVGGMRDEAEIKGHRRTYVGAMPGKIIQGLKIVKSRTPVFMIDEVDKLGSSYQGDPASALLEVLDPEQNVSFRDNYLDLPFDVSDIFFILTANTLDTIPEPLLDRAEIISLSGYIDQEKMEIAKKYLIPKTLTKNGMKKNQIKFEKAALNLIAQSYARESGVRHFEKCIDKITRKIAMELVTSAEVLEAEAALKKCSEEVTAAADTSAAAATSAAGTNAAAAVTAANSPDTADNNAAAASVKNEAAVSALKEAEKRLKTVLAKSFSVDEAAAKKYLGTPVFDESEIKKADRAGTAIGLAWTSMGGDTLMIEAVSVPGKEGFTLTGQLGDVMKESAAIALSWVRRYVIENNIKSAEWFEKNTIHVHVPEGATPKDGPSAGITLTTALVSLLSGKTIRSALAMTGELSLTGHVLPIGGLREKTVAAKRNKIKSIIIPKANVRDLDDIPEIVKKGVSFHPVSRIEEVIDLAF